MTFSILWSISYLHLQASPWYGERGNLNEAVRHAMVCWAYIVYADILRERNRLDEALEFALKGVQLCEQTETIVALHLTYTILMRVYLARGEMDAARLAFQQDWRIDRVQHCGK